MKKGKIIGIVIGALVVFGIIMLCVESGKWTEFENAFGFSPSGTDYGFWAGDPDPRLKNHEQDLIWKEWEKKYADIEKLYNGTKEMEGSNYASYRTAFQLSLEVFKNEVNLAHHFGYWIVPDDPKEFLKN